jgi:hypothetical protein
MDVFLFSFLVLQSLDRLRYTTVILHQIWTKIQVYNVGLKIKMGLSSASNNLENIFCEILCLDKFARDIWCT